MTDPCPRKRLRVRSEGRALLVPDTKNPIKVKAGHIGALKRWGPEPRTIRLDELSPPQRRLVQALVDAARREAEREAGPES